MDLKAFKKRLEDEIVEPLICLRNEDEDCGFNTRQVMELRKLVLGYIKSLAKMKAPTEEGILKLMQKLTVALNKLNKKTDYCMLESEVGEELCFFIEDVAFECGLPETDEDITEPWREEW